MADNITYQTTVATPPAGSVVRCLEDGSGVLYPAGVTCFATTVGTPDVISIVTPTAGLPVQQQTGATWDVSTELPAAAALGDDTANPTTTSVGTFPHWYDGTTWDRARGTSADGLLVNLGANNDVTVTGTVTANAGTNLNTSALALESGGNLAGAATSLSVLDDWDDGSDRCRVVGAAAEDAALAGNPVRQGIRASAAVPTAMSADGDAVTPWGDLSGRQVVKQQSGTATTSQVADSAASTTLLAANTARLGASIQNDSSAVLYVKCGTTASATDYSARLVQYSYFEVPYGYTGRIDGIWSSDPGDGAARVTEYT